MEEAEGACPPDAQGSEVRYWGKMGKKGIAGIQTGFERVNQPGWEVTCARKR